MHENRETSSLTAPITGSPAGEGKSRNAGAHGGEESDGVVVPMNPANKAMVKTGAAEWGEGRTPTKEGTGPPYRFPTQRGSNCVPRVGRCASERSGAKHPRKEPVAAMPLVRICAGGGL